MRQGRQVAVQVDLDTGRSWSGKLGIYGPGTGRDRAERARYTSTLPRMPLSYALDRGSGAVREDGAAVSLKGANRGFRPGKKVCVACPAVVYKRGRP